MKIFVSLCFLAIWLYASAMNVGVGIYDMTGPSVEINFMGYAVPGQRGQGIHQRLRARAFAFDDGNKHLAFVSVDGGMGSDLVKFRVLDRLNAELGEGVYTHVRNKCLNYNILFYIYFSFTSSPCLRFCKFFYSPSFFILCRTIWLSVELTLIPALLDSCNMFCTKLLP